MTALRENGFPVPEPLAQSRHTIVMSLIDAFPLRQISSVPNPASLYAELISMILRLAQYGLIHGDFNEFNILIKEETTPKTSEDQPEFVTLTPILIDFPQMVSVDHANAEYYFDRDVSCIKRFFERRFHFTSDEDGPYFKDARKLVGKDGVKRLDVSVEASGFSRKMAKELEAYMKEVGVDGDGDPDAARGDEDSGDDEEDNEEGSEEDGNVEGRSDEMKGKINEVRSGSPAEQNSFVNDISMSQLQISDQT
jgi:RIO kinase 2